MPTSTSTVAFDTTSPPHVVFAALTDLRGFDRWLPKSRLYSGTAAANHGVSDGDEYIDRTLAGDMHGRIVELEPNRRLVFVQATARQHLSVRITYEIAASARGGRLTRVGEITTAGMLRVAHPVIVAAIRAENRRTMRALQAHLDRG